MEILPHPFTYDSSFYPIYKKYYDTANLRHDSVMSGPATTRGPDFDTLQSMFKKFTDDIRNISGATKARLFDIHYYHFHSPMDTAIFKQPKNLLDHTVFDSLKIWIDNVKNHVGSKPWYVDEGNVIGGLNDGDTSQSPTSFASALWALNNMWILASKDCSGWASHCSNNTNPSFPIAYNSNLLPANPFSPRPVYYSMLEFQEGIYGKRNSSPGTFIKNTTRIYSGAELYVYSVKEAPNRYIVTIINTGNTDANSIKILCNQGLPANAYIIRLTPGTSGHGNLSSQSAFIGEQKVNDTTAILNRSLINHDSVTVVPDGGSYYYIASVPKGTAAVIKIGY